MQFEPATFAAYATVGPGGLTPPSPYDPADAVYTAATLLCADGGATPSGLSGAVYAYDHSTAYVMQVLVLAEALATDPDLGSVPAAALSFATSAIGLPYRWGATGPDAYDCSGLVQAAYRSAGVALPRVAETQFDAGPAVGGTPLPGDLVFFGSSASNVSHVGLVVAPGIMIDAPYTGADVRADAFPTSIGARFGSDVVVGFTRPSA